MEFCEVASMSMELLSAPYLTKDGGGFYTPGEAARARSEHLSGILTFLPYMAVVDAFQHWVYTLSLIHIYRLSRRRRDARRRLGGRGVRAGHGRVAAAVASATGDV